MTTTRYLKSLLVIAAASGALTQIASAQPPLPGIQSPRQSEGRVRLVNTTRYFVAYSYHVAGPFQSAGKYENGEIGPYVTQAEAEAQRSRLRAVPKKMYANVRVISRVVTVADNSIGLRTVPKSTPITSLSRFRKPASPIPPPSSTTGISSFVRYVNKTVFYVVYDWRHLNGDRGSSQLGPYDTQSAAQQTANGLRGGTTVIYSNIRVVSRVIRVPVRTSPDAIKINKWQTRPRPR